MLPVHLARFMRDLNYPPRHTYELGKWALDRRCCFCPDAVTNWRASRIIARTSFHHVVSKCPSGPTLMRRPELSHALT